MAFKIGFEIVLSERAMMGIQRYDLNLPEIACLAIRDEIIARSSVDDVVEQMNPATQNNHLRLKLSEARNEIKMLRAMGYGQPTGGLKLMARSIPPEEARSLLAVNG